MQNKFRIAFCFLVMSAVMFSKKPKEGTYRGVLILDEVLNIELPFNFEFSYQNKKPRIVIRNADEKIVVDEITLLKDSLFFKMPVFDTEFRCRFTSNNWEGIWINHYRKDKNKIRFKAEYGTDQRFEFAAGPSEPLLEGKWETHFSPQTKDSSLAIGLFHHIEQSKYISGTFLTETGDYRYLEGILHQNKLYLSCFDGSHAFLFIADLQSPGTLKGKFYSGAHWVENWEAVKNENFQLKDAEQITLFKSNEVLNFSFPDPDKNTVTLNDPKFLNKPMIIQIMGTWCPNCMDETRYLSELYKRYQAEGLEIVALAFEKTEDFEKAKSQVLRLKSKLNVEYDILITQQIGKDKASQSLPLLNKISAFPTTLFLNREHKIVKTHTGFSGPATGKEYEVFKQSTEQLILQLLKN